MHDHDVIFIPKFQNSFTLSSRVLISNLLSVTTHLLWFSKFGLISLIMHDYDVIISHHHKKSACVTVLTILWTHYKKNWTKKFFVENLHVGSYIQTLIRSTNILIVLPDESLFRVSMAEENSDYASFIWQESELSSDIGKEYPLRTFSESVLLCLIRLKRDRSFRKILRTSFFPLSEPAILSFFEIGQWHIIVVIFRCRCLSIFR